MFINCLAKFLCACFRDCDLFWLEECVFILSLLTLCFTLCFIYTALLRSHLVALNATGISTMVLSVKYQAIIDKKCLLDEGFGSRFFFNYLAYAL